jgi:hypothetical protein
MGLPEWHTFYPTFEALLQQSFKDFEVIVVDALYPKRKEWLDKKWSFPFKYVPVHPNHRFWLDRKRWNICGTLNTGILHAEGELIVRIDDCSEFDQLFLQKFWDGYNQGYFPLAMHVRYLGGKPARFDQEYREKGYEAKHALIVEKEGRIDVLRRLYGEGGIVRDTRWTTVEQKGGKMIAPSMWYYGYSSISLEAALKVNGYDENFDADKSLEDMDMGNRLAMAGYKNMFLLDVTHSVIEHEHEPIPSEIIAGDVKPIKCNYALYLRNEKRKRWKANSDKLTEEDIEFIRSESLKPPCSPRPDFYADDCEGKLFKLWVDRQAIFDLREERLSL